MVKRSKPGWFGSKLEDYLIALQNGDASVIPWIFCVFAENHAASKTTAAKMLSIALAKLDFDGLIKICDQMRKKTSMEWGIDWRQLYIENFFTPEMGDEERRAIVILASFNPNGYIREQAMIIMKNYAGTLPFAILRQNDWVRQVRTAANETVDYRLSQLSSGELTAALPFADKLSRGGRAGHNNNTYARRIYTALASPEQLDCLSEGLSDKNIHTRRFCLRVLINADTPLYDLAYSRLKCETDPLLRSYIFKSLVAAGQNLSEAAKQFVKDKYPLNRVLAFKYICNNDSGNALQTAKTLLLDKNATVRENARFFLRNAEPSFDFRAFYKAHLNDFTASSILGLGETGLAEDAVQIEGYLKSENISIARAAMFAVMRLNGERYASTITEFLKDSRVGIVKAACNLIIKSDAPDYEKVMGIFCAQNSDNTKEKCFSILMTASKWQRLNYILVVLETCDGSITKKAKEAVDRWISSFNRSYATIGKYELLKITERLERIGDRLPSALKRQLSFVLR